MGKIIIVSPFPMIPGPVLHPKQLLNGRKDHRLAVRELQVDLLESEVFLKAKSPGALVLLIFMLRGN